MSNVTGTWVDEEIQRPDYWVRHLCGTVRFAEGVARAQVRMRDAGRRIRGQAAALLKTATPPSRQSTDETPVVDEEPAESGSPGNASSLAARLTQDAKKGWTASRDRARGWAVGALSRLLERLK